MNIHPLKELIKSQKSGTPKGIYSACSANELVIESVMERALKNNDYVLIEATANQVNQYGGYTGMTPIDFKLFVEKIASKVEFPIDKIILGGDHLGPLTWKSKTSDIAMEEAKILIRDFVLAGFTKIHVDTSMHLADDDKNIKLDTNTIANRGAILVDVAKRAFEELKKKSPKALHPVYVIGSEVPIPGGAQEEEEGIVVTSTKDLIETIDIFKQEFDKMNLESEWDQVIAVVVQPGVEFGDDTIHEYDRNGASHLVETMKNYSGLVLEGHSTDYQTPKALKEMVEDGIAILKVGPALTFALREGLFALNMIEEELFKNKPDIKTSNLINTLEKEMLEHPDNWKNHYHGDDNKLYLSRKYSFSDRCRYYLPEKSVDDAIKCLFENLNSVTIPLTLLSQYMPVQYTKVRLGVLRNDASCLAKDRVVNCIDEYLQAV